MKAFVLNNKQSLDESFAIRYQTFHETLKWIPANDRKLDVVFKF